MQHGLLGKGTGGKCAACSTRKTGTSSGRQNKAHWVLGTQGKRRKDNANRKAGAGPSKMRPGQAATHLSVAVTLSNVVPGYPVLTMTQPSAAWSCVTGENTGAP